MEVLSSTILPLGIPKWRVIDYDLNRGLPGEYRFFVDLRTTGYHSAPRPGEFTLMNTE